MIAATVACEMAILASPQASIGRRPNCGDQVSTIHSWVRTYVIDEKYRWDGHDKVDDPHDTRREERDRPASQADLLEDGRGVVDDGCR